MGQQNLFGQRTETIDFFEAMTSGKLVYTPEIRRYDLLLTAQTPISHHDAAVQDDSNRMLFNRQKHFMPEIPAGVLPSQAQMDAVAQAHQVPIDMADIVRQLSFPEFVASAIIRLFLDMYNSHDGEGVFSGMERYSRLEARARQAAIMSPNLIKYWNRLCDSLQVPIHAGDNDALLLSLFALPIGTQQLILRSISMDYRSAVALARLWHTLRKQQNDTYAAATGNAIADKTNIIMHWQEGDLPSISNVIDIPAVSSNSLRHQVVREPSWLHLCQHLGLNAGHPGQGPVAPGTEAIFYNGGNICAGAKQPSNTFALAWKARDLYPSLDLLGGVTDSFDLGESRLKIVGYVLCRENRESLKGTPAYDLPAARVSIFDLLDDVTLTRQAGIVGQGQMIFSFETLAAGTQILCRLVTTPFTARLAEGALMAAVETYLDQDGTLGGSSSRGYGHMRGEWLSAPGDGSPVQLRGEYEAYLAENKDKLVAGLCDGTLGTGNKILS